MITTAPKANPPRITKEDRQPRTAASGGQIAKGTAWLMLFKVADRGIGLISTLLLARLLTPADFGLVAMASAVLALTELMSAFGFDSALIQRQNTSREHYDTAWTFNVCLGIAISVLLLVLAVPAARFYHEPRLELILSVLAIGSLVGGLENVGTVTFRKDLNFSSEFRFLFAKRMATFLVSISFAFSFRNYWALVAGMVTGKLASVLISYLLHPYRPRFDLSARKDLLHFSKWIFVTNFIVFLHGRSTDFILGRTIGSYGLGIFNVALETASMPSTELIAPLNRAVYPAYSRLSTNMEHLRARFIEVFGMISLIAFPASAGVLCVADLAVRIVLGGQWLEAVPILKILAISGVASALQSNFYVVFVALGKPKATTILFAWITLISLPTIIVASLYYGALGAAYAHFCAGLLSLIGAVFVFTKLTGIPKRTLGSRMLRPALGCLIMAAMVFGAHALIDSKMSDLATLIKFGALVTLGATTYISSVLLFWLLAGRPESAERVVLTTLGNKLRAWTT